MGVIDYGTQSITFFYKEPAESDRFNLLIKDLLQVGIYFGFQINKVANDQISVDAGLAIVSDGDYVIRLETAETTVQPIYCSSTDCYAVLRWSYIYSTTNYVDFVCTDSPLDTDIILGKIVYSGAVLDSIDYTYRTYGNSHRQDVIITSEDNKVFLNPGTNFWFIDDDGFTIKYENIKQKLEVDALVGANDYYILYDGTNYSTNTSVTGLAYNQDKDGWYDSSGNRILGLINFDGTITITVTEKYIRQTVASNFIEKTTNIQSLNETGIADGELAVFNLTNKDIRTSNAVISTDGTLSSDSDSNIPTEKAVKTYVDLNGGDPVVADLTAAEALTGTDNDKVYVTSLKTTYYYLSAGSAYTRDATFILNTGDGGDTRWIAFAGQYNYNLNYRKSTSELTNLGNLTGGGGSPINVNYALSDMFYGALTGDTVFTFSNPRKGNFIIRVQHNASQYTITFPSVYYIGVTGASAYVYTALAGATRYTIFSIFCDGTNYWVGESHFGA